MDLGWMVVSLGVADLAASTAFYKALGFVAADAEGAVRLRAGDCRLELVRWSGGGRANRLGFQRARADMRDPDGHWLCPAGADAPVDADPSGAEPTPDRGAFEASLPVSDIAVSQAWYERLGFAEIGRIADGTNVTLSNGAATIGLYQRHLDPARLQLIFWQGDIEAMADLVRKAGLGFHTPPKSDARGGKAFMLRDPDGNPVYFINMPSP